MTEQCNLLMAIESNSSERTKMDTNPARGYAKINCRVIHNRFSSGRVLALYELCRNYVYPGKNTGETPWVEINNCLQIMGIDNTKCAGLTILGKNARKKLSMRLTKSRIL